MNGKGKLFMVVAVVVSLGLLVGCGHHKRHRFHGKDFSEHIMNRLDKRVEKLDLSETQKKRYEEIRKKVAASLTEGMKQREGFLRELQDEINREDPDMEEIASLVKRRLSEMPSFIETHIDYFMEFYDILDEEQKTEVIKKIRKKMGKHKMS